MEILPILHTSGQKQLAFWSLKSAPCRIYVGKKGWFEEHLYAVSIKSFGIIIFSIARIIQRLIKMSGILTYYVFTPYWRAPHEIYFVLMCMYSVWLLYIKAWKLERATCQDWLSRAHYARKVHIFWEGHKILQNLHLTFVLCSASQK